MALKRFRLDRVWWLVTPGNPLKATGPADLDRRMAACRALMDHPRVVVTDIERDLGSRYTADTLARLAPRLPGVRLVWLMGADNLVGFHRWEHWRGIMESVPIGVLARPGAQVRAGLSPAAQAYAWARLPRAASFTLADGPAPRWCLFTGPMRPESSTAIRESGAWP